MARIQVLAKRQLADYDRHQPGTLFANDGVNITLDEAYEVQIEVARLREGRGEQIAGYKVGCISQTVQAQLGLHEPVFGHLYESELRCSGVALDSQAFDGLAIEGELAVRLAEDVPDPEWLRAHPREAIGTAFAVIELHNYCLRSPLSSAQELIGNNAMHAGAVLPLQETPIHDADALMDEPITVSKNAELLGTATARALQGGPFDSIVRLAGHLRRFGCRLRRGHIVLTGSPLPLYRVAQGDYIEVICGRFGGVISASVS
jgi:2-keto-4-pentenoate hydratase